MTLDQEEQTRLDKHNAAVVTPEQLTLHEDMILEGMAKHRPDALHAMTDMVLRRRREMPTWEGTKTNGDFIHMRDYCAEAYRNQNDKEMLKTAKAPKQ